MKLIFKLISFLCLLLFAYITIYSFLIIIDGREAAKLANKKYLNKFSPAFGSDDVRVDNSLQNIFWFIQISDIHISKFSQSQRQIDLIDFCNKTIPLIMPDLVIASGDLTHAKSIKKEESKQFIEEWQSYQQIIQQTHVLNYTKWFDVRGNHDSFNVPNLNHPDNLFRNYSIQGQNHEQSYYFKIEKSFGSYSFIAVDTNPIPGPKSPYNFFGFLSTNAMESLDQFSKNSLTSNLTIWFGHHPTSFVISNTKKFQQLIGDSGGLVYLCGHLHTGRDFIPNMYTLQPQGFLELELADWKDNRFFRVMAVDHDMFSFVDVQLNQWPIILITNPKDARYFVPHKEMIHRIATSSHIRILIWSPVQIKSVEVYIDDKFIGNANIVKNGKPLYVLSWNPRLYSTKDHHVISVLVTDANEQQSTAKQVFSTNGSPAWQFTYIASLFLHGDFPRIVCAIYYTQWFFYLSILIGMRFMKYKQFYMRAYLDHPVLIALYRFANHNPLFYSLLIYLIYATTGPIMFGPILQDYWGFIFVYGVKIGDAFIPEAFLYVTESIQNFTFIFPLCVYLLRRIHCNDIFLGGTFSLRHRYAFFILILWQIHFILQSTTFPYGIVTTLCSPGRLGLIPLSIFMLHSLHTCPKFHILTQEHN